MGKREKERNAIALTQQRVSKAEQEVKRQIAIIDLEGVEVGRNYLDEQARGLAGLREQLQAQQNKLAEIERAIGELRPSAEDKEERAVIARKFRDIAGKRLDVDWRIGCAVKQVRELLEERAEQTTELTKLAEGLDLALADDGLDASRFEKLRSVLPQEVFSTSEHWHGRILGKPLDATEFVVRLPYLVMRETVAHCGVYRFGERVALSKEEAEDLLCEDYFVGSHAAPWRCLAPSVMSVADFQAAEAEAQRRGISVEDVCFWRDVAEDRRNEEWYKRNGEPRSTKRRVRTRENSIIFADDRKIKARVLGNLALENAPDGSALLAKIGTIVEMTRAEIWNAVASRAVGPS
jgi:hypothetical protein